MRKREISLLVRNLNLHVATVIEILEIAAAASVVDRKISLQDQSYPCKKKKEVVRIVFTQ